ncbi:MAG: hypothetical protein AAF673_01940 [Pseudomonadota bacterium]
MTNNDKHEILCIRNLSQHLKLEKHIEGLIKGFEENKGQKPDFINDCYAIEITRANYGTTQDDSWSRFYKEYSMCLKSKFPEDICKLFCSRSGCEAKKRPNKSDSANLYNSILLLREIEKRKQDLMQFDAIMRYRFYAHSIQFIQDKNKNCKEIFYTIIEILDKIISNYNHYCIKYSNTSEKVVEEFIKNEFSIGLNNIPIHTIIDKQFYVIVDKLIEKELEAINTKLENQCKEGVPNICYSEKHEDNILSSILEKTKKKINKYNNNPPKKKGRVGNTILCIDVTDCYGFFFEKYEKSYQGFLLKELNENHKSTYFDRIILSSKCMTCMTTNCITIDYKNDEWQV